MTELLCRFGRVKNRTALRTDLYNYFRIWLLREGAVGMEDNRYFSHVTYTAPLYTTESVNARVLTNVYKVWFISGPAEPGGQGGQLPPPPPPPIPLFWPIMLIYLMY